MQCIARVHYAEGLQEYMMQMDVHCMSTLCRRMHDNARCTTKYSALQELLHCAEGLQEYSMQMDGAKCTTKSTDAS